MNTPIDILVVDDKPENILALEGFLEKPDRNIIKAYSGEDALAQVLDHDFGLILLDVQMPKMDGFETASIIRQRPKSKNLPIIFVTALSKDQKHVSKGYEFGAVDYLFKPVIPEILQAKVEVFCQLHRQKRIIEEQLQEIEKKNQQLNKQLHEIKTLRGLLPICSYCKNIRNDEGYWEGIEGYIHEHSGAEFSHGICPQCLKKEHPDIYKDIMNNKK